MKASWSALAAAGALAALTAGAADGESVVPIRKVTLPNDGRYFALPLRVGSRELWTAIDTGSAGLRVLSRALGDGDYQATGQPAGITFGSGTRISGIRATADVAFAAVSGPVAIEVIRRVGCAPDRPRCAEGRLPMDEVGLMGGAIPHRGAPAIIGLARSDIPVTVPFPALGVKRWIIDIPNDVEEGHLVLDPAPESLGGFLAFMPPTGPDGRPMDAIRGCLRNDATAESVCGVIVFDTGAPGIRVSSPDPLPARWPPRTPASLLYQDEAGRTRLVQRFRTGDPAHSSRLRFDDHPSGRQTVIHANASPYLCFDVMVEAGHGPILAAAAAVRPRGPARRDGGVASPVQRCRRSATPVPHAIAPRVTKRHEPASLRHTRATLRTEPRPRARRSWSKPRIASLEASRGTGRAVGRRIRLSGPRARAKGDSL